MPAVGAKRRSRHCNISGAIGEKADVARTSWKRLESLRIAETRKRHLIAWCRPQHLVSERLTIQDRILLTVADSGPGIPEADRSRAVERFVRLEQSRSQPGSGLGLSLAAAVARLHGGELTLEDNRPGLKSVIALPRGGPLQSAG